jgi:hypothetical protein
MVKASSQLSYYTSEIAVQYWLYAEVPYGMTY